MDLPVASIGVVGFRPTWGADGQIHDAVVVEIALVHTGAIVSAAPIPCENHIGDGRQALRRTVVYIHATVVNVGKHVSPWGGDNQVVKPIVIQICQQHRAFLLVFFSLPCVLRSGVNTASILTGEGTNQVEGEGWTGLGSGGHLLNVICIEVHA